MKRRRRPRQQELAFRTWGGKRTGAGRKRAKANLGLLAHVARPDFAPLVPVHATMRAMGGVPGLRSQAVAQVIVGELERVSVKGFRLLHFSVQDDHLHLIAEGDDAEAFSRGMQRLASRIARAVNALVGRRGRFWRERYHRRDLATPRQFRNALVYVTMNFRKHARGTREKAARARVIDGMSSGMWLEGWSTKQFTQLMTDHREQSGRAPPVVRATTWIARTGWKRHGLLDPRECPRSPG